jgi:hypothetical protein
VQAVPNVGTMLPYGVAVIYVGAIGNRPRRFGRRNDFYFICELRAGRLRRPLHGFVK